MVCRRPSAVSLLSVLSPPRSSFSDPLCWCFLVPSLLLVVVVVSSPLLPQLTFEQAAERVKTLKTKPSNDVLLQLYGLYKQATVGDNTGAQPYAVQFEARAKWNAYTEQKGHTHTDAHAHAERRMVRQWSTMTSDGPV